MNYLLIYSIRLIYKARPLPVTKATSARIRNTTNSIHAICVAAPATPENQSTAAIKPMIRNVTAQLSTVITSFCA